MAALRGTPVIAYHNEWCYFESRFGLHIVDFLEPKPGIPPTPSQLARIIREVKEQHIRVIITSPYFPASSAEVVSGQTGARTAVLATSVGAFEDVKTYFDLFDHNIRILTQLLH
jgi:zinc/manganese transport system substrate-binding protein